MAGPRNKQLRFTHLYLKNWRNFVKASMGLERRTFLAGPNASGKTNLLDAFRFLHDLAAPGGGLQEALRKRGGVSRLRCLAARQYPDLSLRVRIGNDEDLSLWEYELRLNQSGSEPPAVTAERVAKQGFDLLLRPDEKDSADPERLTQTCLEQSSANAGFREVASFFRSIRYVNAMPFVVRQPDGSSRASFAPYGGGLLEEIGRAPEHVQRSRLRRIVESLRAAVPQLRELEFWRDDTGVPHLRGRYAHWRPHGAWQTEDQFSDGTLRLLAVLWSVLEGSGPLLVEEPELFLHPEVVRAIPAMLDLFGRKSWRQLLVSTHSPALVEDSRIALDEMQLLIPGEEGSLVRAASDRSEAGRLLDGGLEEPAAGESASDTEQLGLFLE